MPTKLPTESSSNIYTLIFQIQNKQTTLNDQRVSGGGGFNHERGEASGGRDAQADNVVNSKTRSMFVRLHYSAFFYKQRLFTINYTLTLNVVNYPQKVMPSIHHFALSQSQKFSLAFIIASPQTVRFSVSREFFFES